MTQYFKHLTIIILGFVLLFMIVWFFAGSLKRDTESFNLVEALRSSAIANKDNAARIEPGSFYLDTKNFEKDFTEIVKKQPNYLNEPEGKGIKGIRAYVETAGGIEEATCILSTPEGG